jgi:hypothetical protein
MKKTFKREHRYMVLKLDLLSSEQFEQIFKVAVTSKPLPFVDCVVVEKDWPEYEPTWQAIQARVEQESHPSNLDNLFNGPGYFSGKPVDTEENLE